MSSSSPLPSLPFRFTPQTSDPAYRRQYLDAVGKYTQLASDVFVVVVFIYFNLYTSGRGKARKQIHKPGQKSIQPSQNSWFNARANTTAFTGQKETNGSLLLTSVWAIVVSVLVLWRTGDDYLHITRSPAQVASALLGVDVVFSLPFLRDYTPQLISFHRLQSLLIFVLVGIHATLYLNFYIQNNLLTKRIRDIDVQLGVLLMLLSVALWITGAKMQSLRSRFGANQARFTHVSLTTTFGIGLWFHVAHSHANMRRAGLVWAMGQTWRIWKEFGGFNHSGAAAPRTAR